VFFFLSKKGNVTFKDGSRVGQIKMEQLIAFKDPVNSRILDLKEYMIYVHDRSENEFYEYDTIKWHGKNPPKDHTIRIKILLKISNSVFMGMSVLATIGVFIGLLFLFFNIRFRKHRFIKMSSPYLNNLIIIGCLLSYGSIYFLGEYESLLAKSYFKHICVVRVWLLTVGFTLAFGAMFSKTYRVHAILTNATLTKKVMRPCMQ
jgi:gamma-aminobutyric acid type B receptor